MPDKLKDALAKNKLHWLNAAEITDPSELLTACQMIFPRGRT